MIKVYLAGEGRTELGDWAKEKMYRGDDPAAGVLEFLLRKVRAAGWQISEATQWKHIRKLRSGEHRTPEMRNVLGATLHADEQGCEVLAFSRDRDGDTSRAREIEAGIAAAQREFPAIRIIGGVAIEQIESWVLAAAGKFRTESATDAEAAAAAEFGDARLETLLAQLERAEIANLPADAGSLQTWLARAEAALQNER